MNYNFVNENFGIAPNYHSLEIDDNGITLINMYYGNFPAKKYYFPYGSFKKFDVISTGAVSISANLPDSSFVLYSSKNPSEKKDLKNLAKVVNKLNAQASKTSVIIEELETPKDDDAVVVGIIGSSLEITNDGIFLKNTATKGERIFFPYGSMSNIEIGASKFKFSANQVPYTYSYYDKSEKNILDNINPSIAQRNNVSMKEYRMQCDTCGHIYCYTYEDIKKNEHRKAMVKAHRQASIVNTLFVSTASGNLSGGRADNLEQQIVDFNKCPKCNSSATREITEDAKADNLVSTPPTETVSPYDELKKMKELLDMGIITQEEFDAKKKELLGL